MQNEQLAKYKNPVLIKDEDGKVKQTTYDLPGEKHAYGKKVKDDPEPIKKVVNHWSEAMQSEDKPPTKKNFMQLNKMTAKTGLYTAKDQKQFRKHTNVMVKEKKGQKMMPIMLPEQDFTYGKSNRPSTPVKLVIGNCYAIEEDNKNRTIYQAEASKEPKGKIVAHKTKSQMLREQKVGKEKEFRGKPVFEESFKMPKFSKTGTRTNTNLTPFQSAAQNVLQQSSESQNV